MEKIPSVRSISMGIWIGTGSKYEEENNNGSSHFIEHMLFKGTTTRTAREIAEAFDSIGGNLNAFTSKENTCYYAKVLDQHLPIAFEILADMFFNSIFDKEELAKEKNVILEELKMYEDSPDEVVHDLIAKATYMHHPLGYTILGKEKVLKELTADSLRQYMCNHYTPSNTVIAIAGNIDEDLIIQLTNQYFHSFKSKKVLPILGEPEVTFEHLIRVKETEQAHMCIGFKGLPLGDPQVYALVLLNNMLGGSMSSRLFQEIREERGLVYSVFSYHSSYIDTGTIQLYAGTTANQLEMVYDLCMNILQSFIKEGLSSKELHNGKEQLKGNLMLSLESTSSRMSRIGKNELLLNRHLTLDEIILRIDAVTLEDVHQLARSIFQQKHSFALVSTLDHIPNNIHADRLLS